MPVHGAEKKLPHSLLVKFPHGMFSSTVLGEGCVNVCVGHTSAHLIKYYFLMNYAYIYMSSDGHKLCMIL